MKEGTAATVSRNFRVNPATLEKMQDLRERYGSYSAVLTVAVDRLYEAEMPKKKTEMEKCERCGKEVSYLICYGDELICQDCLDIATGRKKAEKKQSLEDALFGDHKCHACGSEDNLVVDYTIRDTGEQVWICRRCRDARARLRARVQQGAARDRWEEQI